MGTAMSGSVPASLSGGCLVFRLFLCEENDNGYKASDLCTSRWRLQGRSVRPVDGYPEGQGLDVLRFLRGCDLAEFKEKVRACRWITEEEYELINTAAGIPKGAERIDMEQAEAKKRIAPQLSRDTGSKVLQLILDSESGLPLYDSRDFGYDSLFCEWCYVVNIDHNFLEIYRGFNHDPAIGLWEDGNDNPTPSHDKSTNYYPITRIAKFSLDMLPSDDVFLSSLTTQEEEEEVS